MTMYCSLYLKVVYTNSFRRCLSYQVGLKVFLVNVIQIQNDEVISTMIIKDLESEATSGVSTKRVVCVNV